MTYDEMKKHLQERHKAATIMVDLVQEIANPFLAEQEMCERMLKEMQKGLPFVDKKVASEEDIHKMKVNPNEAKAFFDKLKTARGQP